MIIISTIVTCLTTNSLLGDRSISSGRGVQMILCFVYYETIKREIKIKPISECRCDERLKTKSEESTRLVFTGLFGELGHLKIETRLIDEKFVSVMGECVI